MAEAHFYEGFDGGVIYDLPILYDTVMSIGGIGVEGYVCHHNHLRYGILDGPDALLHEPIGIPGFPAGVVLQLVPALDKEEDAFDAEAPQLFYLFYGAIDAATIVAGHGGYLMLLTLAFVDEEGDDKVVGCKYGLGHHGADGWGLS